MATPYVDVHTHNTCPDDTICIQNVFAADLNDQDFFKKGLYFSSGLHPWHIGQKSTIILNQEISALRRYASCKSILAIGETGLDKSIQASMELQEKLFVQQIQIAEQAQKPLIIHCVRAYDEILRIRKNTKAKSIWVIHGFNSSLQMAQQLLQNNCWLSFGPLLLKKNTRVAKVFPLLQSEQFFLETDDSGFSPDIIYRHAARLLSMPVKSLTRLQKKNFDQVFC